MKVQIIQKHDKYFLRRYIFGFIPLYWDESESCWGFTKWEINLNTAEQNIKWWKLRAERRKKYAASKIQIVKETEI